MTVPMLQDYRQSFTSLHARPRWTDLRPATAAEQALAAEHPEGFWLAGDGEAYYALAARRLSDRLVRVVQPAVCGAPMTHQGYLTMHADGTLIEPGDRATSCTLPRHHFVQVEDSDHADAHGCRAPVLVHQSTIREVRHVANEWPDGIHTCEELQRTEPGRRRCTCGRCPS